MDGEKILVKKKDPPVCPWILVWSVTKFWWKRKTLLYVPEFWYGVEQNSGEKERPSCMSLNFGTLWNKILVKKKDPPVCPETKRRFFWLFCVQIKIVGSNQKSLPQIFDIWCKNISFSPGFEFRLVSGGSREVSYSAYLPHFLFNSDMKTWASSKFSSLES